MSSNKCARCEQTVYPVEGLRCLDKIWHKGCFKCHECNMTLNMKNYKGFEKRPYCNAHCPQAKATTVADTPESRRLAENTRIQSQAKYHEDFEKSKGKGFTTIADDPETRRIKETSKIISNVAYHGELERKKQMEERRGISGPDSVPLAKINSNSMFNNNNDKDQQFIDMNQQQTKGQNNHHSKIMNNNNPSQNYDPDMAGQNHRPDDVYPNSQNQQDHQRQVQRQQQQQQLLRKQQQHQQLLKQQQVYAQDQFDALQQQHIGHPQNVNDLVHPQHLGQKQQQKQQQKQFSMNPQQQQLLILQQQQQQLLMQHQFQRQSLDPMMPINNRQAPKQQTNNLQQQIIKNNQHQQGVPQQQQQQPTKYVAINEIMPNQALPPHIIAGAGHPPSSIATHYVPNSSNNHQLAGPMHQNQRLIPNHPVMIGANQQHQMMHVYNNQMGQVNGVVPKQQPQFVAYPNQQQHRQMLLHPTQMQPMAHHQHQQHPQMRPPLAVHQRVVQQPPPPSFTQQPPRIYRAMYDYVANDVDEVSFFENDMLVDCVNVDRNWLIGKVARSGQTGMLPANYVTELPSQ